MKKILILSALLAASSFAHAADDAHSHTGIYINNLCEEIKADSGKGDSDHYLDQLKVRAGKGVSSSAMNKPEFQDDEAEAVVDAFMDLNEEQRSVLAKDPAKCRNDVLAELKKQG
ncbi:hypothetical protein CYR55_04385 [Chimaeribacter californicus]|uniref:Uncharacterized protein n=1 Tax=Chimaeribacter californicus TaxID=2060067 RepID=A0A2N5EF60_9GAMM|nr:hypothetical protein [Chimaeribacter californicus]PLR41147.1 hypothetical protein CYR55_04385 [Chimaeribacter californicus]